MKSAQLKKLNFIGCGNVGRTLGRLFHEQRVFRIGDILTLSLTSAGEAAQFIGAGRPVGGLKEMKGADITFVGTPDSVIAATSQKLSESGLVKAGSLVFHCSGALPSSVLDAVKAHGGQTAAIHPVKSFSDPACSVTTFPGTFCDTEGDGEARDSLCKAFKAIGARPFVIDAGAKSLYHAASAIVSNYLTALMEMGLQVFQQAGLTRERALAIAAPLARGTIKNILKFDTVHALTGPIARGDSQVIASHMEALCAEKPEYETLYRQLGKITLDLSRKKGATSPDSLRAISKLLEED